VDTNQRVQAVRALRQQYCSGLQWISSAEAKYTTRSTHAE
jgi:hypothetical protein